MSGGGEIRDVQRAAWAGLSAGWENRMNDRWSEPGPVGAAMIGCVGIAGDQRHLDVAAGTGEPGLTVARLAPGGHVVLTDLAAEMSGIAARRAVAQGITNVGTAVCSADDLPFGDAAFDSISVRFGYMFFPAWPGRPPSSRGCSGRADVCARRYGLGPGQNPWTAIAMQAIAAEVVLAPPGPGGPGMFRCAAAGYVSALYLAEVPSPNGTSASNWWTDSPAQYWEMISEHASLAVAALAQAGKPTRERIAEAVIAAVTTCEQDGRVRIPGVARCIAGTK